MVLNWNEIKERAVKFSKEWAEYSNEEADAKPFLVEFFNIFGIYSKKVATFEHRVKKLDERDGYIDLLWKGTILIEMKSRGKNLDKAFQQAKDYLHGLKQHELPKYILVSDFEIFKLHDLEEEKVVEFKISELVNNVHSFGFLLGYQKKVYKEQDPANVKAAELMGKLHDRLKEIGYDGHPLEVYLVRLLFCLFAEDTTIFNKQQFQDYITNRTNEDGSDLAPKLQELFQILDTPIEKRFKNLDEDLMVFPYINGKLFQEILPMASFDTKMRIALLECCYIDWSKISPAIFGSMFQSVMNPKERRNLGAHYTSETNILKLIKPLFLDELWAEFENIKNNKNKLPEFHKKISQLRFLDPACGCGNFLVITYRELRLLEIAVLRALNKSGQGFLDVSDIIWLDVDMMCGIEYEEFPARIAEVAMWLIDHQMNMLISNEFGQYFARLPLKKSAKIVHGNALQIDWEDEFIEIDYIIGNPPFIGYPWQNAIQKKDVLNIFGKHKGASSLDYVSCWFALASKYMQNKKTKCSFVSTNSITQGEQVYILWTYLLEKFNIKLNFAHRTFKWSNEAKGNAGVHCVIIGFSTIPSKTKTIFEYANNNSEPQSINATNINPYLIDAKNILLESRRYPICNVSKMTLGSMAKDGGNLLLSQLEKEQLVKMEPNSEKWLRPFLMGDEFLNNIPRWCLWLVDITPQELKKLPQVMKRVEGVKNMRLASVAESTRKSASTPTIFKQLNQPNSNYLAVPRVSSEKRLYIPIGYLDSNVIAGDKIYTIPNTTHYHFGILTSLMHNSWMRVTCGRLESRYSYSNSIVYNNYPWPENPTEKQIKQIEEKAQKVLEVRSNFPNSSLADLYNPLTMPPTLVKAHNELDKAVDAAYRTAPFTSEANRMVYLFELYSNYTADLFTKEKPKKRNNITKYE